MREWAIEGGRGAYGDEKRHDAGRTPTMLSIDPRVENFIPLETHDKQRYIPW